MSSYLQTFWGILLEISPFVILGMLAAGLMHELLGRYQRLRNFAMKRGFWSLSFFNLSGFTLPICSCGVIPIAVGLRRRGVPLGNILAFVFAAPATSVAAVILSLAVFGAEFTLFYVIGALLCGYLVGLVFYSTAAFGTEVQGEGPLYLGEPDAVPARRHGLLARAVRWGTVEYGGRIAFDLILGLSLAALIVATYSSHDITTWVGGMAFWPSALLVILIAIPLYVCSIPGILVGAALVLGGFTPGLLWIFLMAGPVTNLGDINVLRRNLGWRSTLGYVAVVVVSTLIWGWVIEMNVQWDGLWTQVRDYYAMSAGRTGLDGGWMPALSGIGWLGIPLEVHYVSAVMVLGLTLNGAWKMLRTLWLNPCGHCWRFQADMHLSPSLCSQPCWKRRVPRVFKRFLPSSVDGPLSAAPAARGADGEILSRTRR